MTLPKKMEEHKSESETKDGVHSAHSIYEENPSPMDYRTNKLEQLLRNFQLFGNLFIDATLNTPMKKAKLRAKFFLSENLKFTGLGNPFSNMKNFKYHELEGHR